MTLFFGSMTCGLDFGFPDKRYSHKVFDLRCTFRRISVVSQETDCRCMIHEVFQSHRFHLLITSHLLQYSSQGSEYNKPWSVLVESSPKYTYWGPIRCAFENTETFLSLVLLSLLNRSPLLIYESKGYRLCHASRTVQLLQNVG